MDHMAFELAEACTRSVYAPTSWLAMQVAVFQPACTATQRKCSMMPIAMYVGACSAVLLGKDWGRSTLAHPFMVQGGLGFISEGSTASSRLLGRSDAGFA